MNEAEKPLVNRVANSALITINLEDYYPQETPLIFDLKNYLFKELILKEKDFRTALKELDWQVYQGKDVLILCSTDAIIPIWAYMLVAAYLSPIAEQIFQCDLNHYNTLKFKEALKSLDPGDYKGQRVVIKGCSEKEVPVSAYVALTKLLQAEAQSIMYGEPCSTVPVFKRPREIKK